MDYLTKKKLAELKEELETLKTEGRKSIAENLKTAKEMGDLSENAEYIEAREQQQRTEKKISELEQMVRNAVVIGVRKKHDEVEVGSTVAVERDGEKFIFHIVGSNEAKPAEGFISNESPLGEALLGHKEGEVVDFKSPRGKVKYKINKID
ncbi:MAG: transcription elongation factor GreA [Candidatus Colwellbacteria bacterium CG10_big_fil_rev_8_21_14_0_10_42_22]|uniref:Transcription elongation factor GreA n=1 Tax=Candidatus Colwellbacteria bacterium CG10_big_fil_rev_8_21_14_0_10_42_22 TaxID=1974540 RepID=A0A2H0VFH4_9BACT|nr:MAG: transcription elongation factor GreA [Candidatus Colwellbacteria bacterium CG10_big_fil_rev_8_21_14_0_10_42_22]